jgi:TfoX/Sxy family transcriptional regulator of competence genes
MDADLPDRLREVLQDEGDMSEKRMFGGIAFLVNGNMAVSASGQGGLLLRVGPEQADQLLDRPHASIAVMRGREMRGWMRIASEGIETMGQLREWARHGVDFARSLPPKR